MLTLQEKAYIRDLLTVPMAGVPTGGNTAGYRYLGQVGQLEYYMNNLGIEEESIISGRPIGVILASGVPVLGQTLTININSTPVTYTVQASDLVPQDTLGAVLQQLVNAVNAAGLPYFSGSINYQLSTPNTLPLQSPQFGQFLISGQSTCTLSVMNGSGGMFLQVYYQGNTYPEPSMDVKQSDGSIITKYGYIQVCLQLRRDILSARTNLALASAGAKGDQGGAQFRPDELVQRIQLFRSFTAALGNALYAGPDPTGRMGGGGTRVRL